jgi:hypothetical protein
MYDLINYIYTWDFYLFSLQIKYLWNHCIRRLPAFETNQYILGWYYLNKWDYLWENWGGSGSDLFQSIITVFICWKLGKACTKLTCDSQCTAVTATRYFLNKANWAACWDMLLNKHHWWKLFVFQDQIGAAFLWLLWRPLDGKCIICYTSYKMSLSADTNDPLNLLVTCIDNNFNYCTK